MAPPTAGNFASKRGNVISDDAEDRETTALKRLLPDSPSGRVHASGLHVKTAAPADSEAGVTTCRRLRSIGWWLAAGAGMALGVYGTIAALLWVRYGHASRPYPGEDDDLLNRFMPVYDVVERHHVRVAAPAAVTLDAAKAMELWHIPGVRAIIKARERILGTIPDDRPRPRGMLEETQSLGWVVLGEVPGREVAVGAVTKPWEANVTFRSIPPECFAAFAEPGYVKIVWTLRADPIDADASVFRTETRAIATDVVARRTFRRYWSFLAPGIILIRWLSLGPVRAAAERAARERQV